MMYVLIAYDVNTQEAAGRRRLSRVAKICSNHGQRVQNSVFECWVDGAILETVRAQLSDTIDHEKDSIRIYRLGKEYYNKIITMGLDRSIDIQGYLDF